MNRSRSIFRLEPGAQKRQSRPHNTVYNAFSRPSSLQVSAGRARDGSGVVVNLSRTVGTSKKDRKLVNAISAMGASREMLDALLSDAFGHAAVKHAQDTYGGGWTVDDSRVAAARSADGGLTYSSSVRLKRFIG